ncbi:hypothetical protein [Effusibacillus dendaii]|uniref:Uncharacterized protein n=1 Tax=Effusibacillus dendaii TaxID=2743772 RepID=A0A7I8D947_9BACL|nr:hypothetical protein [Effusibacillus dendaii]BCJ86668.1 hypothetical protein skT53_16530 [Effusibacillus dendaii]
MPLLRDRPKITQVQGMKVTLILLSGVLQVGDTRLVEPFYQSFTAGGSRGAASFITRARHIHSATRLHYNNQTDHQISDDNLLNDQWYDQILKEIEEESKNGRPD